MKSGISRLGITTLTTLSALLLATIIAQPIEASTFSLYPSVISLHPGETQDVEIILHTDGEQVNAYTSAISYPAQTVSLSQITPTDSFAVSAEQTDQNGVLKITRGTVTPVSGDIVLATVTVTGTNVGTGTFSFTNGSAVAKYSDSTDSLVLGNSTGASVSVISDLQPTTDVLSLQTIDTTVPTPIVSVAPDSTVATDSGIVSPQPISLVSELEQGGFISGVVQPTINSLIGTVTNLLSI